jgi:hypothetical protein
MGRDIREVRVRQVGSDLLVGLGLGVVELGMFWDVWILIGVSMAGGVGVSLAAALL